MMLIKLGYGMTEQVYRFYWTVTYSIASKKYGCYFFQVRIDAHHTLQISMKVIDEKGLATPDTTALYC